MTIEEYNKLKIGDFLLYKEPDMNYVALFKIDNIIDGIPYYNPIYTNYMPCSNPPFYLRPADTMFQFSILTNEKEINYYYKLAIFK